MTLGPGIHFDVPSASYFSDPCEQPSLTQSIAKILIDRSPAHAWVAHPRLNPRFRPDDDAKFDVGNIAHRILLGRGKELVVIDADDWRTKAAKEAREAAAAQGRLGVLQKHVTRAQGIVDAARAQLAEIGWLRDFEAGQSEVVVIADEGGTLLRSMIDRMADPRLLFDLKTTSQSVAPHAIPGMMVNAGWDVQAAFQERVLDLLDPEGAARRTFRFIAVEDAEPYALTPVELTEAALTMGRKQVDAAVNLWRTCVETNLWPTYGTEVCRPEYPGWAETRWLEREVAEEDTARGRSRHRRNQSIPSLMGG